MRRMNLFSAAALAAMAALSLSCNKVNDVQEPVAPHPVSFELGLGVPGTKVSMTQESDETGSWLKSAWEVGDEISVFWATDNQTTTDQYETFTVTAVSADGKTATFSNASSNMPSDCTLGIYYPAKGHKGDAWKSWPYVYSALGSSTTGFEKSEVQLSGTGDWALYGKSGVTVTGGVIPAVSLEQKSSFLLIKAGTVIAGLDDSSWFRFEGLKYSLRANTTESSLRDYTDISLKNMTISTANTVPFDIYVPFVADGTQQTVTVKLEKNNVPSAVQYTKSLGTKTLEPGKVYDISAKLNGVASD